MSSLFGGAIRGSIAQGTFVGDRAAALRIADQADGIASPAPAAAAPGALVQTPVLVPTPAAAAPIPATDDDSKTVRAPANTIIGSTVSSSDRLGASI